MPSGQLFDAPVGFALCVLRASGGFKKIVGLRIYDFPGHILYGICWGYMGRCRDIYGDTEVETQTENGKSHGDWDSVVCQPGLEASRNQ